MVSNAFELRNIEIKLLFTNMKKGRKSKKHIKKYEEIFMKITTIFFDLDGTLLPMNQEEFTKRYFHLLCQKMQKHGYQPEELMYGIWEGTKEMLKNDGLESNEVVFWKKFHSIFGDRVWQDRELFEDFYHHDFAGIQVVCGKYEKAAELITNLKKRGFSVCLATNPIFPEIATRARIEWAGLRYEEFDYVTTYENSEYAKPNPKYYESLLKKIGKKTEECFMVGNDTGDDMVAEKLGMQVFLLTDSLINERQIDISKFPHGNFEELWKYCDNLNRKQE